MQEVHDNHHDNGCSLTRALTIRIGAHRFGFLCRRSNRSKGRDIAQKIPSVLCVWHEEIKAGDCQGISVNWLILWAAVGSFADVKQ